MKHKVGVAILTWDKIDFKNKGYNKRQKRTHQFHKLGIYPKKPETLIWKDICMPMFIVALFTIVKIQKQPKCPPIDKRIKMMWYINTLEYYSDIIKNKILPWPAWLTWLSVASQRERLPVQFPVRAQFPAWVVGQVPVGVPVRGNWLMFVSLSFSLHSPIFKNK